MAKTELTKQLEKAIIAETSDWFGCLEVTIGWYGSGRVDFMTMDSKEIFRCYEIKISKSDFHSKHGHNFVGNYNYYVMPKGLFEEVKEEIPDYIGVYCGYEQSYKGKTYWSISLEKRPKKQELKEDIGILKNSMIRSLYRDVCKLYQQENEDVITKYKRKINNLEKEVKDYKTKYQETKDKLIEVNKENILSQFTNEDNNLFTYKEWCPILEKENNMRIIDDDGATQVRRDRKTDTKLTKQEAFQYFIMNTVEFNIY